MMKSFCIVVVDVCLRLLERVGVVTFRDSRFVE